MFKSNAWFSRTWTQRTSQRFETISRTVSWRHQRRSTQVKTKNKKQTNKISFLNRIMRLDNDSYPIIKVRCTTNNSLLTTIADEINQLPKDIFSIERISDYRTRKSFDNHQQNGIILRCKLLDKANPILPPIRLHVPMIYPEQAPEILSLTKTPSPKLDFSDGHPLFERISSIFVSHLFKLRPQHTITEILNIWVRNDEEKPNVNFSNWIF